MRKLLKRGNHKLPRTTAIFNLPHLTTCPGATADCKKYCYARKAEVQYKQVLPYRYNNFAESKLDTFVQNICTELRHSRGITAVRVHESGDFYCQAYVDKWEAIARQFPNIQFTFYTKSFHLFDFTKIRELSNVTAFASIDPTTPLERLTKANGWAKATVILRTAKAPNGYFLCPGSCKSCTHCYNPKAHSVAFKQH